MRQDSMPSTLEPMLALPARSVPRDGDGYGLEFKWDGFRMIAFVSKGTARFVSRGQKDYTAKLPDLAPLGAALARHQAVLDGEVIALLADGRPSFQALQNRIGSRPAGELRADRLAYVIFDVLHWDGESLLRHPYRERRARLEGLELKGSHWDVPPALMDGGADSLLAQTRQLGIEGIVAKRLDRRYEPGRRSGAWLKVKNCLRQEFVIVGWAPGEGRREGTIGALLLGHQDPARDPTRPVYCGKVGTGFTQRTLAHLMALLEPLAQPTRSAVGGSPPVNAHWVRAKLVAEVEFTEWTEAGEIRHPSFKGLRYDKPPDQIVRDPAGRR